MQTRSTSTDIQSTQKLTSRVAANSHASRDFDEWCMRQFPDIPLPARILDLGCGTGKQVLLFSPIVSPKSEYVALDLAKSSLEQLKAHYRAAADLSLIEGSFDTLELYPALEAESFDLIYVAYALYYTKDLQAVLRQVHRLLKPGGTFWMIGPYSGTNDEFLRILRPLHEVEDFMDYVFDRFPQQVIAICESLGFRSITPSLLRNKVAFPDATAFMKYLSNSLFYRPGHDQAIMKAVQKICDVEGRFQVSKNIISLQLTK
ncbi:MAG: class I SAM-dependent methyltransferase [Bacteroidota bacterium]